KAVFFYDAGQSIKPSDANAADFQAIKSSPDSMVMRLVSQFRVQAGRDYVQFHDERLNLHPPSTRAPDPSQYEFLMCEKLSDMVREIDQRNQTHGLARLVAGYAWPWVSRKDHDAYDIRIGDVQLRWNSTSINFINTPGAEREVGCIHTTQGYDLNYAGVIF